MALCKEILLPNGTIGNYHIISAILRLDYERKVCNIVVASYSSKESFENGDEIVDRNKEAYNEEDFTFIETEDIEPQLYNKLIEKGLFKDATEC
jgi:hypothetical protein